MTQNTLTIGIYWYHMRQTISYSRVVHFEITYDILLLEDIYKANGYLKMFCNILANIKEHQMGCGWQYLDLLNTDSKFPFSLLQSQFVFVFQFVFFQFFLTTILYKDLFFLWLPIYCPTLTCRHCKWKVYIFFFLLFLFFSFLEKERKSNPRFVSYWV